MKIIDVTIFQTLFNILHLNTVSLLRKVTDRFCGQCPIFVICMGLSSTAISSSSCCFSVLARLVSSYYFRNSIEWSVFFFLLYLWVIIPMIFYFMIWMLDFYKPSKTMEGTGLLLPFIYLTVLFKSIFWRFSFLSACSWIFQALYSLGWKMTLKPAKLRLLRVDRKSFCR